MAVPHLKREVSLHLPIDFRKRYELYSRAGGPRYMKNTEKTEGYIKPDIAWEETLEESGVFAACAKDSFGEQGPGCLANPFAGGPS